LRNQTRKGTETKDPTLSQCDEHLENEKIANKAQNNHEWAGTGLQRGSLKVEKRRRGRPRKTSKKAEPKVTKSPDLTELRRHDALTKENQKIALGTGFESENPKKKRGRPRKICVDSKHKETTLPPFGDKVKMWSNKIWKSPENVSSSANDRIAR